VNALSIPNARTRLVNIDFSPSSCTFLRSFARPFPCFHFSSSRSSPSILAFLKMITSCRQLQSSLKSLVLEKLRVIIVFARERIVDTECSDKALVNIDFSPSWCTFLRSFVCSFLCFHFSSPPSSPSILAFLYSLCWSFPLICFFFTPPPPSVSSCLPRTPSLALSSFSAPKSPPGPSTCGDDLLLDVQVNP